MYLLYSTKDKIMMGQKAIVYQISPAYKHYYIGEKYRSLAEIEKQMVGNSTNQCFNL